MSPAVPMTHHAAAAGYADRVVFLRDGALVEEMVEPTVERVLEALKTLER